MKVLDIPDNNRIVYDEPAPESVTYTFRKVVCPDGWTQRLLVHDGTDLYTITESTIIKAIMTLWRAT